MKQKPATAARERDSARPAEKAPAPRLLMNGEPTREDIAQAAYLLWEQQGRPQNQDIGIWLQAETQLRPAQHQHGVQA
jgi:hypothetical protein